MDSSDKSNKQKIVAVMFGGRSVEHEISIITALQLIEAIDTTKYKPLPVYITNTGKWYCGEALLRRDFYKNMPSSLSEVEEVVLLPIPNIGGLTILSKNDKSKFSFFGTSKKQDQIIPIDIYLPAFHGNYGEDGCMQGLLELADVAYTGSNLVSSALSMSKYHCKKFLESHKIPVLPSVRLVQKNETDTTGNWLIEMREQVLNSPGFSEYPLFVKPANLGSSIGIAKAKDKTSLDAALLQAFKYDSEILVEPCLEHKIEINVSVLSKEDQAIASVVEIPVASGDALSYEDKYIRGGGGKKGSKSSTLSQGMASLTRVIDPEDLATETKEIARNYACKAFKLLSCSGVARIDFMLDLNNNNLYFNEINPLPGSLSFYLWAKSKPVVLYTDLISNMLDEAENRKKAKTRLARDLGFKALFK